MVVKSRFRADRITVSLSLLSWYAGLLAAGSIVLAAALVYFGQSIGEEPWAVVLLGVLALGAERQPVRISPNAEITVAVLPILFAAVQYGALAAMTIAAVALLSDFRPPYTRWVIWTSLRALAGGLAGVTALIVLSGGHTVARLVIAVASAALTEAVVDICLGAVVVSLRCGAAWTEYLHSVRNVLFATVPFYTPILILLLYAYEHVSSWSVLLFFGPAFVAHKFYRLYQEQREVTSELEGANNRLERANLSFATALVATLDARDRYTAGHSSAAAIYAQDIALSLALPEDQVRLAHLCGLVHDIGKVGLPAGLLEKPGPLTMDERRQMEEHSVIGERILAKVDGYAEIALVVRHHHERVDGHGYPDGLVREEIPLVSRIIAVADAYDAMTSDRPYRTAMSSRVARLRLRQGADLQFDAAVVDAFLSILARADGTYRLGLKNDFTFGEQQHLAETATQVA